MVWVCMNFPGSPERRRDGLVVYKMARPQGQAARQRAVILTPCGGPAAAAAAAAASVMVAAADSAGGRAGPRSYTSFRRRRQPKARAFWRRRRRRRRRSRRQRAPPPRSVRSATLELEVSPPEPPPPPPNRAADGSSVGVCPLPPPRAAPGRLELGRVAPGRIQASIAHRLDPAAVRVGAQLHPLQLPTARGRTRKKLRGHAPPLGPGQANAARRAPAGGYTATGLGAVWGQRGWHCPAGEGACKQPCPGGLIRPSLAPNRRPLARPPEALKGSCCRPAPSPPAHLPPELPVLARPGQPEPAEPRPGWEGPSKAGAPSPALSAGVRPGPSRRADLVGRSCGPRQAGRARVLQGAVWRCGCCKGPRSGHRDAITPNLILNFHGTTQ